MVLFQGEILEEHKSENDSVETATKSMEHSKRVVFDQSVRVILIPSRGEYRKVGLYSALWWNSFEFGQFQASAQNEIRAVAAAEGIGARAARRKLYQPTLGEDGQWEHTRNHSDDFAEVGGNMYTISNMGVVSAGFDFTTSMSESKYDLVLPGSEKEKRKEGESFLVPPDRDSLKTKTIRQRMKDDVDVDVDVGGAWREEGGHGELQQHTKSTAGATPPDTPQCKMSPARENKAHKRPFDIAKYSCGAILSNGPTSKDHKSHRGSVLGNGSGQGSCDECVIERDTECISSTTSDFTTSEVVAKIDSTSMSGGNEQEPALGEREGKESERGTTSLSSSMDAEENNPSPEPEPEPEPEPKPSGVARASLAVETISPLSGVAGLASVVKESNPNPNSMRRADSMLNIVGQMKRTNSLDCIHLAKQGLLPDLSTKTREEIEHEDDDDFILLPPPNPNEVGGPHKQKAARDDALIATTFTPTHNPASATAPTSSSALPVPAPIDVIRSSPTTASLGPQREPAQMQAVARSAVETAMTRFWTLYHSGRENSSSNIYGSRTRSCDSGNANIITSKSIVKDVDAWDSLLLYVPLLQPTKLDDSGHHRRERHNWVGVRRKGMVRAGMDFLGLSSMGPLSLLGWLVIACSIYIMATDSAASSTHVPNNDLDALFGGNITL